MIGYRDHPVTGRSSCVGVSAGQLVKKTKRFARRMIASFEPELELRIIAKTSVMICMRLVDLRRQLVANADWHFHRSVVKIPAPYSRAARSHGIDSSPSKILALPCIDSLDTSDLTPPTVVAPPIGRC